MHGPEHLPLSHPISSFHDVTPTSLCLHLVVQITLQESTGKDPNRALANDHPVAVGNSLFIQQPTLRRLNEESAGLDLDHTSVTDHPVIDGNLFFIQQPTMPPVMHALSPSHSAEPSPAAPSTPSLLPQCPTAVSSLPPLQCLVDSRQPHDLVSQCRAFMLLHGRGIRTSLLREE